MRFYSNPPILYHGFKVVCDEWHKFETKTKFWGYWDTKFPSMTLIDESFYFTDESHREIKSEQYKAGNYMPDHCMLSCIKCPAINYANVPL